MKDRTENANQILRDATAHFLAREAGPQSLITVTRTHCSDSLDYATIYISVLPVEQSLTALKFAERSIPELKRYFKEHTKLPRMPHIEFIIDRQSDDTPIDISPTKSAE